ncbi:MAG: tyrosine-type recombinase/integrase [Akkermansiaceae bacterium]|jgi:integrase
MAKPIRFTPVNTKSGWRINIPSKVSETGRRQQFFYRTQKLAKEAQQDFKKKYDEFGSQTRAIPPTIAEQAMAAKVLLDPFGITILEAASRVAAHERQRLASVKIEAAISAYKESKEAKSVKHRQAINQMANHLLLKFRGIEIADIKGIDVDALMKEKVKGETAFNARLTLLKNFWRWCAHPKRDWCKPDALNIIERKDPKRGEIGVLTAAQAEELLRQAEKHLPDCIIPICISLYTGMRQAELLRLKPADITDEGVVVSAANDRKNNRRRYIQMPSPLAKWLKTYPIIKYVCPANYNRKQLALKRLAGFGVWSDYVKKFGLKNNPDENLPDWPQNALRHTAASVTVALKKPLPDLLFEHGHTGGEETLKANYLGLMPPSEAKAIWNLAPKEKS